MKAKTKWVRVSRANVCPVCQHSDYCTLSEDGAVVKCMRIESPKPVAKGGWIHEMTNPIPVQRKAELPAEPIPLREWSLRAKESYERESAAGARVELAGKLGVSVESLEMLGVGVGYDDYQRRYWSMPERDSLRRVRAIQMRYPDGKKFYVKGSKPGLYLVEDWRKPKGPILVVEGASDTAACLTMGLCVIGRPSNTGGVNLLIPLVRDSNRPVIVIGEMDEKPSRRGTVKQCPLDCKGCSFCWPGMYGASMTADALKRATKRRISWRMCPDGAKDSREWLNKFGADGGRFLSRLTAR